MRTQTVLKNEYINFKTNAMCGSIVYNFDVFFSCFDLIRIYVSKNKKKIITLQYNCREKERTHLDCMSDSEFINFLPYFINKSKKIYSLEHGL